MFDFLLIVFGSGAGFTVASLALEQWRYQQSRRERARHLAIRLAFALEGYAIHCADELIEKSWYDRSGGHDGTQIKQVPQPTGLPQDISYEILDSSTLEDILDFPQRCRMADRDADVWWKIGDEEDVSDAVAANAAKMGQLALRISCQIRQRYTLRSRAVQYKGFDLNSFFIEEIDQRNRKSEDRATIK